MIHIRVANGLDSKDIRDIYLCAFPEGERQKVSTLAVSLLNEETNPDTISLVAEADSAVVGHIAFSPVTIDNSKTWSGYILAPLGIKPKYQKRRIGSKLTESGIERLSKMSVNVVFVYGDPQYYGKFGFSPDVASRYSPPYELQYPFGWQAISLDDDSFTAESAKLSCAAPLSNPELW